MVDHIAELAHCGEKSFVFEELLEKSDLDFKSMLRDSVMEMLQAVLFMKFPKEMKMQFG